MTKFGNNDLITARVALNAIQLLAMFAVPVPVIPAPGKNKAIVIDSILVQTVPGTVNFAAGGVVTFVYHGGGVTPHAGNIPAATVLSATGTTNMLAPVAALIQIPANTGVDITNATGAFTLGNGAAIVTIWYSIQTLG